MTLAAKAPEERRRRILLAATEVLRARGFAGTRVADIAAAAGTSPALVLYHFSSLGEVLVAALTSVDDQFYKDLAPDDSAKDPRNILVRMAVLASEGGPAFGDWQLWLEVWVRARHDARIDDVRAIIDKRWRNELTNVIKRGVHEGVFRTCDPFASAVRLSAMLDGLAVQVVLGDEDLSPEQMASLWIDGAALELGTSQEDLRDRIPSVSVQ